MRLNFVFKAVSCLWKKTMNSSYHKSQLIKDFAIEHRVLRIKPFHIGNFFKIIDVDLQHFLKYDKCCRIADNYLIAMVFFYFIRANLEPEEYTFFNFITALHLTLDMEEEDDDIREDLKIWYDLNKEIPNILDERIKFFQRIEYRASVSRRCCESIMRQINPNHIISKRKRHVNHSGAII